MGDKVPDEVKTEVRTAVDEVKKVKESEISDIFPRFSLPLGQSG